jgi:hypothetical protein
MEEQLAEVIRLLHKSELQRQTLINMHVRQLEAHARTNELLQRMLDSVEVPVAGPSRREADTGEDLYEGSEEAEGGEEDAEGDAE